MSRALRILPVLLLAVACGPDDGALPAYVDHDEPSDFETDPGDGTKSDNVAAVFDRNNVLSDAFFLAPNCVDGDDLQAFFESTPYKTRSWLADETVDGTRAADVIVAVARAHGINPILLLARMQVEKSLVAKTARPSGNSVDYAFGCGCYDGQECLAAYKGFDRQLDCAATTLRKLYDASADGTGQYRVGKTTKTLDKFAISPVTHATASLYGYTPWVLEGQGGTWLVWNVTRKYTLHLEKLGLIDVGDPSAADPWVGRPCTEHDECFFSADGSSGFCFVFTTDASPNLRGFCTLPCEGFCPDKDGKAGTFCTSLDGENGFCASRSDPLNHACADIPGTAPADAERFIGSSSAAAKTVSVCLPK